MSKETANKITLHTPLSGDISKLKVQFGTGGFEDKKYAAELVSSDTRDRAYYFTQVQKAAAHIVWAATEDGSDISPYTHEIAATANSVIPETES